MSLHRHAGPASGARQRALRLEALEDRSMLAIAAFTVNLYEDVGGAPGAAIHSDAVVAGQSFFLEITAQEFHPYYSGMAAVALDIGWNPQAIELADEQFDPAKVITEALPEYSHGTLDSAVGTITDLSGISFPEWGVGHSIGDGTPERFALLHFRALTAGESTAISLRQGDSGIATMPVSSLRNSQIAFDPQVIAVVAPELAEQTEVKGNETPLAAAGEPAQDVDLPQFAAEVNLAEAEAAEPVAGPKPAAIPTFVPNGPQPATGPNITDFDIAVEAVFSGPFTSQQGSPLSWSLEEVIAAITSELAVGSRRAAHS